MKRPVYPHPKTLKVFCWIVAFLILFARFFRRAGHFNYITMMWIACALFTGITIYIILVQFQAGLHQNVLAVNWRLDFCRPPASVPAILFSELFSMMKTAAGR